MHIADALGVAGRYGDDAISAAKIAGKYGDGLLEAVDNVLKYEDELLEGAGDAGRYASDVIDASESMGDYVDETAEAVQRAAEGAENTKLYRVMSDAEYQSIINNRGKFSNYDRAMEEKWFTTSPEDAAKWAEKFYPSGQYRMIEIEIPTDSLNQMYQVGKLDGIGPAYSGGINFLNSIMKGLKLK